MFLNSHSYKRKIPYRAKVCRARVCQAKVCRAKFSSPGRKCVPFAQNFSNLGSKTGEAFVGRKYSFGESFAIVQKIRHFHPIKFRLIRYILKLKMARQTEENFICQPKRGPEKTTFVYFQD